MRIVLVMVVTGMRGRACGLVAIGVSGKRSGMSLPRHAAERQQAHGNCDYKAENASHGSVLIPC